MSRKGASTGSCRSAPILLYATSLSPASTQFLKRVINTRPLSSHLFWKGEASRLMSSKPDKTLRPSPVFCLSPLGLSTNPSSFSLRREIEATIKERS